MGEKLSSIEQMSLSTFGMLYEEAVALYNYLNPTEESAKKAQEERERQQRGQI